jgi:hypothetical protein
MHVDYLLLSQTVWELIYQPLSHARVRHYLMQYNADIDWKELMPASVELGILDQPEIPYFQVPIYV